jgi:hypothetical protein
MKPLPPRPGPSHGQPVAGSSRLCWRRPPRTGLVGRIMKGRRFLEFLAGFAPESRPADIRPFLDRGSCRQMDVKLWQPRIAVATLPATATSIGWASEAPGKPQSFSKPEQDGGTRKNCWRLNSPGPACDCCEAACIHAPCLHHHPGRNNVEAVRPEQLGPARATVCGTGARSHLSEEYSVWRPELVGNQLQNVPEWMGSTSGRGRVHDAEAAFLNRLQPTLGWVVPWKLRRSTRNIFFLDARTWQSWSYPWPG